MRIHTGKAFKTFEDWNTDPDIANAARELYGDIDRLELYPGLHAEGHHGDSFGKQESNTVDSTSAVRIMDSCYCCGMPFIFTVCLSVGLTHDRSVLILPLISLLSISSYNLFITFA